MVIEEENNFDRMDGPVHGEMPSHHISPEKSPRMSVRDTLERQMPSVDIRRRVESGIEEDRSSRARAMYNEKQAKQSAAHRAPLLDHETDEAKRRPLTPRQSVELAMLEESIPKNFGGNVATNDLSARHADGSPTTLKEMFNHAVGTDDDGTPPFEVEIHRDEWRGLPAEARNGIRNNVKLVRQFAEHIAPSFNAMKTVAGDTHYLQTLSRSARMVMALSDPKTGAQALHLLRHSMRDNPVTVANAIANLAPPSLPSESWALTPDVVAQSFGMTPKQWKALPHTTRAQINKFTSAYGAALGQLIPAGNALGISDPMQAVKYINDQTMRYILSPAHRQQLISEIEGRISPQYRQVEQKPMPSANPQAWQSQQISAATSAAVAKVHPIVRSAMKNMLEHAASGQNPELWSLVNYNPQSGIDVKALHDYTLRKIRADGYEVTEHGIVNKSDVRKLSGKTKQQARNAGSSLRIGAPSGPSQSAPQKNRTMSVRDSIRAAFRETRI